MDELTRIERESIRAFVQSAADDAFLSGRVLDFGCGSQPYRKIVEEVAVYVGFDRAEFPANESGTDVGKLSDEEEARGLTVDWDDWNAVLCTQVIQYAPQPVSDFVGWLNHILKARRGHLVLTYPTNWPEVNEGEDLWRFTRWGMEQLLTDAGFEILKHEPRWSFRHLGYEWVAGYGCIARA